MTRVHYAKEGQLLLRLWGKVRQLAPALRVSRSNEQGILNVRSDCGRELRSGNVAHAVRGDHYGSVRLLNLAIKRSH